MGDTETAQGLGEHVDGADLLVIEGRVQKQGKRGLSLIAAKVFNPLDGLVADRIDGKTGLARRDLPLPEAPEEMEVVED